jgi:O-antigen/teichoic acid export membrane protein
VAIFHWGIWGIFGASAVTSAIFGIALTGRELARGGIRFDSTRLLEVLRFAAPFVPGGLCYFVLQNGDRFFLMRYAGADALGLYALGNRLASVVAVFTVGPLYKVWSARMYDAFEMPHATALVGRVFTRILAAYVFVAVGLCLFCNDAIALLGSPAYARATDVVRPCVLAGLFLSAASLMDAAFYVRRRTGLKPWIMGGAMIVTVGFYAWLIHPFGAMGAAYAALGGCIFLAAATWAVSQRVFLVRYEYGRLFAMLATAIALVLLTAEHLGVGGINIPIKLAVWAVWPAVLWGAGLISKDEKAIIVTGVRRACQRCYRPFVSPSNKADSSLTEPTELR